MKLALAHISVCISIFLSRFLARPWVSLGPFFIYSSPRGAAQKSRDQLVEPVGLIPLHPMCAFVEDMEFRMRQGFQQQNRSLDGGTAIVSAP